MGSFTSVNRDPSPNATMPVVVTGPLSGTYTVNADGTGTMTLQSPDGATPVSFVITDAGSGLTVILTGGNNGNVVTVGTARKQ